MDSLTPQTPPGLFRRIGPLLRGLPGRPRRRLLGLTGAALLAAGLAAGLLGPSCCRRAQPPAEPTVTTLSGLPTVRVRLTCRPIDAATISTTGPYRLIAEGRCLAESDRAMPASALRRYGPAWQVGDLPACGQEILLAPAAGHSARLGQVAYRGQLRLTACGEKDFHVTNHVDLESYLAGVLPRELYPNWSAETYRALAAAARTFALCHMLTSGRGRDYDLGDDQGWQVYGGSSAETEKSWSAVHATRGLVLVHGPSGQERMFLAQYSACCGGYVNGAAVLRSVRDIPPLTGGQQCLDCSACPRHRWGPVRIAKADVHRALLPAYSGMVELGGVAAVRVVSVTDYGRPVWLDVVGPNGRSLRIRAEDLRLALLRNGQGKTLYSMNCNILDAGEALEFADGKGFGHGVGLCQWGAEAKARQGWLAEQIIAFYYPGAALHKAY